MKSPQPMRSGPFHLVWHRVSFVLIVLALVYAFLAGFHTILISIPGFTWPLAAMWFSIM